MGLGAMHTMQSPCLISNAHQPNPRDAHLASGGYNYHHDVNGPPLEYRFDLVFPLLVIAAYLISLLAILFAISVLIQVSSPALPLSHGGAEIKDC